MITVSLSIDTSNDAFAHLPEYEVRRLLQRLADRVSAEVEQSFTGDGKLRFLDVNGNQVGIAHYTISADRPSGAA